MTNILYIQYEDIHSPGCKTWASKLPIIAGEVSRVGDVVVSADGSLHRHTILPPRGRCCERLQASGGLLFSWGWGFKAPAVLSARGEMGRRGDARISWRQDYLPRSRWTKARLLEDATTATVDAIRLR